MAPNHILIADCVELSRFVEGNLDREKEDFELQVSSPGATEAFKVVSLLVQKVYWHKGESGN